MKGAWKMSVGKLFFLSLMTAAVSSTFSTTAAAATEPETITIAWLPNDSAESMTNMREEVARVIAEATGKKVENKLTTDYAIAIAALENGDAQIGWFGANEYLTSHAKHPEVIPLVVNTGPSGTLKDAQYYSRLVVKKGNEALYKSGTGYSIDNIVGKRASFVSPSSTSGFVMPAAAIVAQFGKQPKWNHLTNEDLSQGGSGKFFKQVMFGGSHQLSLVNLLTDRVDVAAVCDFCVAANVDLVSGKDNTEGAVYKVKQGADAPFTAVGGKEFVIIKSISVLNPPVEVNSNYLSKKTMDAITNMLSSDKVANNPKIFAPAGVKGSDFQRPARFVKVADSWYDPMRAVLGMK